MKNVLWISRHQMTENQEKDLAQVLGDQITITQYADSIVDVNELSPLVACVDVVCAVLPIHLLQQLLNTSDKPVLQAKSQRIPTGNVITLTDGRKEQEFQFIHSYWEQIHSIQIVTRRLYKKGKPSERNPIVDQNT